VPAAPVDRAQVVDRAPVAPLEGHQEATEAPVPLDSAVVAVEQPVVAQVALPQAPRRAVVVPVAEVSDPRSAAPVAVVATWKSSSRRS